MDGDLKIDIPITHPLRKVTMENWKDYTFTVCATHCDHRLLLREFPQSLFLLSFLPTFTPSVTFPVQGL